MGCHFLLQEISPTKGSNPHLLHWQADSLPLSHLGSVSFSLFNTKSMIKSYNHTKGHSCTCLLDGEVPKIIIVLVLFLHLEGFVDCAGRRSPQSFCTCGFPTRSLCLPFIQAPPSPASFQSTLTYHLLNHSLLKTTFPLFFSIAHTPT